MSQIFRESIQKFETVTLDYEIPVWKEGSNNDGTLKRITLKDFFASDLISTVLDPPNWATSGLSVTGSHTHDLQSNTVTLEDGTHIFASSLVFRALGTIFMPNVPQNNALTKLAVFDSGTGQVHWRDSSTLSGNYFDKTSDDTDDITEGTNKFTTAANLVKLGHISVSQAVDLDQMEIDIAANNLKVSNVSTNLSEGTATNTTVDINSSDGTNATLASASTSRAGLLSKTKFDEIEANNLKVSNQDQDISGIATNAASIVGLSSYVGAVQATTVTNATAIALNTAKVTNATHTGEVTGSGALTIADDVVDEANLKVSNAPTNGHALIARSGETGGLKWEAISATVADGSVTNAKLADVATNTFKGRATAGTGSPEDLTAAQARTILNVEDGATADQTASEIRTLLGTGNNNLVPAAGTAGHFLKHDGTFGLPAYIANTDTQLTNAEVRAAVEAATDSNVFTDADHTKLNGIETSADVTDTTNVVAALTAGTNVTIAGDGTISATGGTASPLTTKGDLYGFDTANQRLPVGTNGQALIANSSTATGLEWQALPGQSTGSGTKVLVQGRMDTTQSFTSTAERIDYVDNSTLGFDINGEWDNTTHRFTVAASGAGVYQFTNTLFVDNSAGWVQIFCKKNGVTQRVTATDLHSTWDAPTGSTNIELAVGDYVEFWADSTTSFSVSASWYALNNFQITKIGESVTVNNVVLPSLTKTIILESPADADYIPIFRTDVAITIQEALGALMEAGDVDVRLYWDTDLANTSPTAIGASTTLTTTTEAAVDISTDPTIPANSWIFLDIGTVATAKTTVVNIRYTE